MFVWQELACALCNRDPNVRLCVRYYISDDRADPGKMSSGRVQAGSFHSIHKCRCFEVVVPHEIELTKTPNFFRLLEMLAPVFNVDDRCQVAFSLGLDTVAVASATMPLVGAPLTGVAASVATQLVVPLFVVPDDAPDDAPATGPPAVGVDAAVFGVAASLRFAAVLAGAAVAGLAATAAADTSTFESFTSSCGNSS